MVQRTESWTTPGTYQWTVPDGVEQVDITTNGAAGEDAWSNSNNSYDTRPGAPGGSASGTLPVTPGETLYITVGAVGGGGLGPQASTGEDILVVDAGSGGSHSDVRQGGNTASDQVIVAAGGAGGTALYRGINSYSIGDSGSGGASTGQSGGGADNCTGGSGGTQSAGGSAGTGEVNGNAGSRVNGADGITHSWGSSYRAATGGGGNGYYGGGSAGASSNSGDMFGAGSAGGSCFVGSALTDTSMSQGSNSGDGSVTLEYEEPPYTVTGLTATAVDATTNDLSWDSDNNDSYNIYRDTAPGVDTSGDPIGSTTSTLFTDGSLTEGQTYYYVVTGVFDGTEGGASSEQNATTDLPAPTLDSVTAGSREVAVSWTLNDSNPDGDITVFRGGSAIATVSDLTTTSYTDTRLLDGEQYSYSVERDTDDATASSGSLTDVTDLPAPTGLSDDTVGATSVNLSWTDNHNNGVTRVEYKQSDASTWTTFNTLAYGTGSETVTDLLHGEQYDARVVAQTEHTETVDQ